MGENGSVVVHVSSLLSILVEWPQRRVRGEQPLAPSGGFWEHIRFRKTRSEGSDWMEGVKKKNHPGADMKLSLARRL